MNNLLEYVAIGTILGFLICIIILGIAIAYE